MLHHIKRCKGECMMDFAKKDLIVLVVLVVELIVTFVIGSRLK